MDVYLGKHTPATGVSKGTLMSVRCFTLGTIAALTMACDLSAAEGLTNVVQLKIGAQPMSAALLAFSGQARMQVVSVGTEVKGIDTQGVEGTLPAGEALTKLLAGTGLSFELINDSTVRIFSRRAGQKASNDMVNPETTPLAADPDNLRLAQTDIPSPAQGEGQGEDKNKQDEFQDGRKAIPEILVKGSRSTNTDIARSNDDILPYVVIGRRALERSSAPSVDDFLKSQLPMNAATTTFGQSVAIGGPPRGTINLRGLGTNQTLILVDGQRIPGSASFDGDVVQGDISGIPLSSIERIEILPATAGAIYGGSATGGVINIIRRHDYSGIDVGVKYANSFANDVGSTEYHLNGGANYKSTSILFGVTHSESNPLLAAERDFALRSRLLLSTNAPTSILQSSLPPSSTTSNICAARAVSATTGVCNGSVLVLDNGQSLGKSVTSVPVGYGGVSTDGGAGLLGNAGAYNLSIPNDGQYLISDPVRDSVSLDLRQSLSTWLEMKLSGFRSRSTRETSSSGTTLTVLVPRTAANNPFQQDVVVNFPLADIGGHPAQGHSEIRSLSSALIFRLPHEWVTSIEYGQERSRYSYTARSAIALSSADMLSLQSSAFLFQSMAGSPGTSNDLSPDTFGGPFTNESRRASLHFAGPVFDLSAGPATLTGLVERRDEKSLGAFLTSLTGGTPSTSFLAPRSRRIDSIYLEANIPLVARRSGHFMLDSFDLQASARHDKYGTTSTAGVTRIVDPQGALPALTYYENNVSSTDYLLGFRYAPIRDVLIRASRGTGFLPPGLSQLTPVIGTSRVSALDPRRGGTAVPVPFNTIGSGNPHLEPETSTSWSGGLIFTPRFLEEARLSIDYTYIRKNGEISLPTAQYLIDNEATYSSRITRGANLPTDQPGWAGPITGANVSLLNVLYSSIKTLDIQADYHWQTKNWGELSLSTTASQFREFARKASVTTPVLDYVGNGDGPIRWRGVASIGWQLGRWSASWSSQYYDSYRVTGTATSPTINALLIANQGSTSIPAQLYHDLYVRYRTPLEGGGVFAGTTFSLGIGNVLNSSPLIIVAPSAESFSSSAYSQLGDPRLRRYLLSIEKSFGK